MRLSTYLLEAEAADILTLDLPASMPFILFAVAVDLLSLVDADLFFSIVGMVLWGPSKNSSTIWSHFFWTSLSGSWPSGNMSSSTSIS